MSRRAASSRLMSARAAVERGLDDVAGGSAVVVACSGGPDSLALAGVTAWVGERRGLVVHAVVVDHALQAGSAEVADRAARQCRALGIGSAAVVRVNVGADGGPEAAARTARYDALLTAAGERGAAAVLLGHTRDDQAETVLLRLARGSGARSLSAMRARSDPWRRPFLDLPRADVHAVAAELLGPLGEEAWSDPHNDDHAFTRVRVRALLGGLTDALGAGAVLGLTRSADLLRDDADALDALAEAEFGRIVAAGADDVTRGGPAFSAECAQLALLPRAVRTRVIRLMALECGCPADEFGVDHVARVEALVVDWRGQGELRLPGRVVASRSYGRLCLQQA